MLEGALVGVQELRYPLVERRLQEVAAAVAEREHEQVKHHALVSELDPGRAPVDLTLLPVRGLEAHARPLRQRLGAAQRLYEPLHGWVAAREAALPQLLEQHLGRVPDLGGSLPEEVRMRRQQRVGARGSLVGRPALLPQTAADGLAVEIEATRDLSDGLPLVAVQPVNLLPAVFLDHVLLLEGQPLEVHGPTFPYRSLHAAPPQAAGGALSMTLAGDYCMTADRLSAVGLN